MVGGGWETFGSIHKCAGTDSVRVDRLDEYRLSMQVEGNRLSFPSSISGYMPEGNRHSVCDKTFPTHSYHVNLHEKYKEDHQVSLSNST